MLDIKVAYIACSILSLGGRPKKSNMLHVKYWGLLAKKVKYPPKNSNIGGYWPKKSNIGGYWPKKSNILHIKVTKSNMLQIKVAYREKIDKKSYFEK